MRIAARRIRDWYNEECREMLGNRKQDKDDLHPIDKKIGKNMRELGESVVRE